MSQEFISPATEPIPINQIKPSWGETFSVLRVPNFRRYLTSYSVLVTSLSMQRIMLAWAVLEVSGNMSHVGFAIAMQFLPMLLLGIPGGVVADKWPKIRVLFFSQIMFFLVGVSIFITVMADSLTVATIYIYGLLIGVVQAFQMPASQGLLGEMVSGKDIPKAVSFLSSSFQMGQVIGPALGGVLLAKVGAHISWGTNLVVLVFSFLMFIRIKRSDLKVYVQPKGTKVTAKDGFAYARSKKDIYVTLILIFVISICVYATPVFLTAYAEFEFNIGAAGYGILNSIMAAGALSGAFLSAKRPAPTFKIILVFTVLLGISQALMGFVYILWIFVMALFVRGAASLFTTTAANSFIQINTNPLMRGRIMSFYSMMMTGGMALGNLIVGALVATYTVRPVMIVTGLIPAVVAVLLFFLSNRRR